MLAVGRVQRTTFVARYLRSRELQREITEGLDVARRDRHHPDRPHGIGPSGAARLLVDVGDITRFPCKAHFASWTGTAPIDASSGDHVRHRLSRGGNRKINRTLHLMAVVQPRNPTEGRAYYDHKKADGKSSMEAMRCLERKLSDVVYRQLLADLLRPLGASPGGTRGRLCIPARPT